MAENNDGLPAYNYPYKDGLYATIAGYVSVKDVELKNQKKYNLWVESFKKKLPVRAVIQKGEAPLVVVLLGIDGRADGKLGKLWPSWFAAEGCHVLTFDSTFLPSFIEISNHGVTGNLTAESERIRDIIAAFVKIPELRGKVSQIGIVGMSYGGLQALLLGQMAKDGKLPFEVSAVQAYSPPIRLHETGKIIDKWFAEDRWNYTLIELSNQLTGHKPAGPESEPPFSPSLMRAGIAAGFRLALVDVVVRNDRVYKLNALPSGTQHDDQYVKQEYAATWGYTKFMDEMAFPYWSKKQNLSSVSDLVGPFELPVLLNKQPPYSQVILAEDDPFNRADDLSQLKSNGRQVTLLPRGGHLGFVGDPWTKAKLLSLFKAPANRTAQAAEATK